MSGKNILSGVPSPYSLSSLTDGNPATSWKVLSPNVSFITFEFSNAQVFNSLMLTSSDDNPSRDPKSWIVKAANDTLAGWTVLDNRTNQAFTTREFTRSYSFVNNAAYKFYRLHIQESKYSTSSTMLGELAFRLDSTGTTAKVKQLSISDTLNVRNEFSSDQVNTDNKQLKIYSLDRTLFVENRTDKAWDICLYNIYGRFVLKQPFENNAVTAVPLNFPAGIYVLVGVSNEGRTIKNILIIP